MAEKTNKNGYERKENTVAKQVRKKYGKKGQDWRQELQANPKASFKNLLAFLPSIGICLATSGLTTRDEAARHAPCVWFFICAKPATESISE